MWRGLSIYGAFLGARLKMLLEYRANFFIGVASTVVLQVVGIAGVWVVLQRVPRLHGWGFEELLLVYGLLIASRSIEHMFADNLWVLSLYLREGSFDRFLVRPVDPLLHLLADRFHHHGLGTLLTGLVAVGHAWASLGLPVTVPRLAYAALAIISGGLIFIALNLATATTAFWLGFSLPVTRAVHELHELAKYPLSIYDRGARLLLTWVVPFGFASYFPASHLLGRDVGLLAWVGPPLSVAFAVAAYGFWRMGLRRYSGAGS